MNVLRCGVNKPLNILSVSVRYLSALRSCQEIKIPVPWGTIAGKWWGPQDKRPILALHGWQDNCGTFDTLIPYLPDHIPVLAIDFPGHGLSSQLPPGIAYNNINSTILIKRIIKLFDWKKVSFMGHSMGAISSFTYGFLFPKEVDFMICIDGLHPLINPKKMDRVAESVEEFMKYDELNSSNIEPPCYTFEEMKKRLYEGTKHSVELDVCKYLLARNISPSKKHPDKFYFKRDARTKVGPLECPDPQELIRCATKVTFPLFISMAEKTPFFGNETIFKDVYATLQRINKTCHLYNIPGTHHVHLNNPEVLEQILNNFIEKYDIEDRSGGGIKPGFQPVN